MSTTSSEDDTRLVSPHEDGFVPPQVLVGGNDPSPSVEEPVPEKATNLTWNQIVGSVGAGFASASTGACVAFTAVAQPMFETEADPNLRMDLETASWFGEYLYSKVELHYTYETQL